MNLEIIAMMTMNLLYVVTRTLDIRFISIGKPTIAQFALSCLNSWLWISSMGISLKGMLMDDNVWYKVGFVVSTGFASSFSLYLTSLQDKEN
jgi:hypothetical protein